MTTSDWAAWVQAVGSVVAIGVAIWVPWKIHQSEREEARRSRISYTSLLRDAFENLRAPIAYLDALYEFANEDDPPPGRGSPAETARQLSSAIAKMQDVLIVIRAVEDVKRLDDYEVILAILDLRRKIEAAVPDFEKEAQWLYNHGTSQSVVDNALKTLGFHAHDLRARVDAVLAALGD